MYLILMNESLNDILGEISLPDEVNLNEAPMDPAGNITEQVYLELSEQFKEINEKKSDLIKDLKKAIMVLYSLIKVSDDNHDVEMIVQARQAASEYIDQFFFNS